MKQWFYSENEVQAGPVGEAELIRRIEQGDLPPDTLVWADGMQDWVEACELETFRQAPAVTESGDASVDGSSNEALAEGALSPYAPPSAVSEPAVVLPPTSGLQVRPWVRLWARTVDIIIFGLVLGGVLGAVYPEVLEMMDALFNVVMLLVMVFIEAACFAVFGTTPGKAIFRVSVRHADGSRLNFVDALNRSFKVFIRGLGLGIPLVSLITQVNACSKLTTNGITSWDRDANLVVGHQTVQLWRWLIILLIISGFVALVSWGNSVE